MLKPKEDLYRSTMLQSYGDMLPELSYYHQINMPPAVQPDYSSSWYNSPPHQSGVHSGDEYYSSSRSSMSKTPEWNSYQQPESAEQSPYITSQPNSNSVCSRGSEGSYHHSMVDHHSMQGMDGSQSLMMTPHLAEPPQQAPTNLMSQNTSLCQPPTSTLPNTPPQQDEESITKIEGPITPKMDENKDTMKLPGFHQTFGTITEIGRFSQHDDYFESRPDEVVEPIKVSEPPPMEPPPKRKPRGRKRKVAEPPPSGRYEAEPESGNTGGPYPSWGRHHHCCQPDPSTQPYYGGHWASRPHPYYPSHYSPYYSPQYNPPDYHYHHPYHPPYQPNWPPRPSPDYLSYNYHNYV